VTFYHYGRWRGREGVIWRRLQHCLESPKEKKREVRRKKK